MNSIRKRTLHSYTSFYILSQTKTHLNTGGHLQIKSRGINFYRGK